MSGPLDDITIPTTPPPELKSRCADFLKRAAETRKAEPVISYWCEYRSLSGRGCPSLWFAHCNNNSHLQLTHHLCCS